MDSIADMLNRIKNAQAINKQIVVFPYSKLKFNLAKLMIKYGYLKEAIKSNQEHLIKVSLADKPIKKIEKISKPGCRIYIKAKDIKHNKNQQGIRVLTTSKGLMTANQAKKKGLGGEHLCNLV